MQPRTNSRAVLQNQTERSSSFPLHMSTHAAASTTGSPIGSGSTTRSAPLVVLRDVSKSYKAEGRTVSALSGVDLEIARGEFLSIVGRSGCGKSTLLNLLGGLDTPSEGTIAVAGQELASLNDARLTQYRRDTVGIVFQFFNLMPLLTVLENTILPALLAGKNRRTSEARGRELLFAVGLEHRVEHQASLLSGGEMQRVAVARALINDPPLVLADEPTGNLDSQSAQAVLDALKSLTQSSREQPKTVVMVTHSREAAAQGTQVREMRDGRFLDT
jgi:putative ABC transport system ATP-binding protein